MLNPIEKFNVAILHLNRAWNHCIGILLMTSISIPITLDITDTMGMHGYDSKMSSADDNCNMLDLGNTPHPELVTHNVLFQLKSDRPHPHDYPNTPSDYRHSDRYLRLVMTLIHVIALCCTRQSRSPKFQGRRSSGSALRVEMDRRYQEHYLPASRSIKKYIIIFV